MNLKNIFAAIILLLLTFVPVSAEYYQYVDQDGVKHFTDNILEVPKAQRDKLNIHQSLKSSEETTETAPEPETKITLKDLEERKKVLLQEYDDLTSRRQILMDMNEQGKVKPKELDALSTALNNDIIKYREKKDAYEALVNQYNAQEKPAGDEE